MFAFLEWSPCFINANYDIPQVERWANQYIASTGEGKSERNPKMLKLIDWLRQNIPSEDSSGSTAGLVHGDFRIDNLVFHPIEVIPLQLSSHFFCI